MGRLWLIFLLTTIIPLIIMPSRVHLMVCGRKNKSTAVVKQSSYTGIELTWIYQSALGQQLSLIDLPTDMLMCDGGHCTMHTYVIDKYYNDIAPLVS